MSTLFQNDSAERWLSVFTAGFGKLPKNLREKIDKGAVQLSGTFKYGESCTFALSFCCIGGFMDSWMDHCFQALRWVISVFKRQVDKLSCVIHVHMVQFHVCCFFFTVDRSRTWPWPWWTPMRRFRCIVTKSIQQDGCGELWRATSWGPSVI